MTDTGSSGHEDIQAAISFLNALDPLTDCFTFQTFDDNSDRKDPALARVFHGTLAQHREELTRLNYRGAGIYVTVNETDGRGRATGNIIRIRAIFVDLDGAPLDPVLGARVKFHIITETSAGKWHAYWLVNDLPLEHFSAIQKAMAERFDSDPSVIDLPRVMRLPGFFHRKGAPTMVKIHAMAEDMTPYDGPATFGGPPPPPPPPRYNPADDENINTQALKNLAAWVPRLFGDKAKPSRRGGYRVSSRALGRDNDEDLSLQPTGIKDFGVHDLDDPRDGKREPTDILVEWGPKFGLSITTDAHAEAWLLLHLGQSSPSAKAIDWTMFEAVPASTFPRRRWLYRPHYIRQFLSTTIATGGIGKSSLVMAELLAMASGKALLGVQPEAELRVAYWNGEDPHDELMRRMLAAMAFHRLTNDDLGGRFFMDSGRKMPIVVAENLRYGIKVYEPVVGQIIDSLRRNKIDVLAIDPFVSSHRVSENDNVAIERVAKSWSGVAEAANCNIMLVHHSRKTNGEEASVEDARGASALVAAARSARALNTMSKKEAEDAEIPETERRRYFRADLGKTNMTRPAEHADWFYLQSVPLGNGPEVAEEAAQFGASDGDEVGVVSVFHYPRVNRAMATIEDVLAVQKALDEEGVEYRMDTRSSAEPWIGALLARVLERDLHRPSERKAMTKLVTDWVVKGWLATEERLGPTRRQVVYVVVGANRPSP